MKRYNNIRITIFSTVIILSVIFFLINSLLINQLRNELNKQVKTIANIYYQKLINENVDSQYLLETLLPLINQLDVPMIISTRKSDGSYNYQHINIDSYNKINREIEKIVYRMDQINNPLTVVELDGIPIIEIHYGDSVLIQNIRWIPYIEICFAIIVLLLMIIGFNLIWSNEKNHVYVGMAKETAHQLGTPISSLMGWLKLLENNSKDKEKIYSSMKSDLGKLDNISAKFNKIGSKPKLVEVDLVLIIKEIVDYFKLKLPKSKNIDINFTLDYNKILFQGDKILLYWAFENIIKNSIDSIKFSPGYINIELSVINNQVKILFKDNGSGISLINRKNIFKPGFSTKSKGWGIGLNLSKRIIEHIHKGKLKLLKSKNNETIFEIILNLSIP
tara:strand:- start:504 stop:1673 length:1170 start_codon:yes stop_codon:yes gene_type:complete